MRQIERGSDSILTGGARSSFQDKKYMALDGGINYGFRGALPRLSKSSDHFQFTEGFTNRAISSVFGSRPH